MEKSWRTAWALWYLGSHVSYAFVSLYIQDVFKGVDLVMRKEKPKKKVYVNVVMDWIVKLLVAVTLLTITGMVVVMALPVNASLKTTCVEAAIFAVIIETIVLTFVVNIAIDAEFDEMKKDLDEIDRTISDLENWAESKSSLKKE